MDNPNPSKVAKVDEIAEKLESADTVLVTEYRGLDVPAQAQLRQAVRDAGGEYKIYKNTLTRLAADRAGVDLGEHLAGPTALAFAYPTAETPADPVSLSKALAEFAKTHNALVIKGGVMDGVAIDAAQITALSKVPPREEMLASFAGLLQAPMAKFAGLLQAMPRDFAGLVKALVDKGGAGVAEEGAPADEDAPGEDAADDEAPSEAAATEDAVDDDAPAEAVAEESADAAEASAENAESDDSGETEVDNDDKED